MLQEHIRPQLKGKSDSEIYRICIEMGKYYNNPNLFERTAITEDQVNWYLDNKVK